MPVGNREKQGRGFGDDFAVRQFQRRDFSARIELEEIRPLLLVLLKRDRLEFVGSLGFCKRALDGERAGTLVAIEYIGHLPTALFISIAMISRRAAEAQRF
jgi:hypothetical protein